MKSKLFQSIKQQFNKLRGVIIDCNYRKHFEFIHKRVIPISAAQVAMGVGALLITIVLSRFTTKIILGQYQFFHALIATLSIIALPGLKIPITQSVRNGQDQIYILGIKQSLKFSLIGSLLLIISGIYSFFTNRQDLAVIFIVVAIIFPFLSSLKLWLNFVRGKKQHTTIAKWLIIQSIIRTIIAIAIIIIFHDNVIFIITSLLITEALFNIIWYLKSKKFIIVSDNHNAKTDMSYGYFLTKINLLQSIANHIDKIIIGALAGAPSLALFTISTGLINKLQGTITTPIIMMSKKFSGERHDPNKPQNITPKTIAFILLFSIMLFSVAYFIIDDLTVIFFSKKYQISAKYAQIAVFSIIFYAINRRLSTTMLWGRNRKAILKYNLIHRTTEIALKIFLFLKFGITGLIYLFAANPLISIAIIVITRSLLFEQSQRDQSDSDKENIGDNFDID